MINSSRLKNMSFTNLKEYDNSWYNPGGTALKKLLWYFANVIFIKNTLNPISCLKIRILKMFGAKIGKGVVIKPGVNIKYPWLLSIGEYTWIGENVWIDNLAQVTIGNNCCISQGAMLLCGNHNYKTPTFDLIVKPVIMEDGAWVGAKATVCPGVILRENSILAVGSVASANLNANCVYQGVPATLKHNRTISQGTV